MVNPYKTSLSFLSLLAVLSISRLIEAQGPPVDPLPLPALIQRVVAAHGQQWVTGAIADWLAEGKLTVYRFDGTSTTFDVTLLRKGLKVQRVIKQPGGQVKQGSDSVHSWESIRGVFYTAAAQGRALRFLESQTVHSMQRLFNFQTEGLNLRDQGTVAKTRVIEAEDRQGKKTNYGIDVDTARVTFLEFVTGQTRDPFSGRMLPATDTYVFSDYRAIQGVLTPFKIERYNNRNKTEETQFTTVRYNAGLRDEEFTR